jgi:hypothetical protein
MQGFIEDSDQNLKYLGLVGLVDLMKVFCLIIREPLCHFDLCFLLWTHGPLWLLLVPPKLLPLLLLRFQSNPRSVCDHRDIVLRCLTDDDVTIRTRSLELLAGIVSKKSLVELVHHLLQVRYRYEERRGVEWGGEERRGEMRA